ncbi:MAG: type II toxin-antitoxin system VapC family toxin [Candidatus Eremiobacteraeota bacterium]|nr:type II toxin-antitoxin system VapC family toxin [Candidatus Eremiobacteraeota bacterium]MBV9057436.1 type II toxin-antitoxin system VapC family toxin [Candidatus Eremiobacteraeota bacterium]MBV9699471.1 type II toxin-antitoxin system VapC family toxin [Candidatus Eremiobacteraeota bacterium]
MNGFLLDTMVVSEGTKSRPNRGLSSWLAEVDENSTYISVFTIGELQKGIARLDPRLPRRADLDRWLTFELIGRFGRRILAFDTNVARHWGAMLASALDRGAMLSVVDSQIAATASLHRLKVVTRNERHFAPTGVGTFNPWSS